ncbi:hypothetical protein DFJ74DRAFT_656125 [Hyaloraphidium curvatum]|nr:hypothetical protein DFJ74DRAFT_656125 [Hyaloraphidium curvatum]
MLVVAAVFVVAGALDVNAEPVVAVVGREVTSEVPVVGTTVVVGAAVVVGGAEDVAVEVRVRVTGVRVGPFVHVTVSSNQHLPYPSWHARPYENSHQSLSFPQ